MEVSEQAIRELVARKAGEWWRSKRTPYLVSSIGIDLKQSGLEYRQLAAPSINLAKYLSSIAHGEFKVVSHPSLRARVGVIPGSEHYNFPEEEPATAKGEVIAQGERVRRTTPRKYVVLNFLEALSDLPQEELDKISLPISVLAKLLSHP